MKKKVIISTVISVVILAAIVGTLVFVRNRNHAKQSVKVYPVSELGMYSGDMGMQSSIYGNVSINNEQVIYTSNEQKIKEIKVSEGDEVKAGDVLVVLDVTKQSLALEKKRAEVAVAQSDVEVAKRELKKLKETVPYEDMDPAVIEAVASSPDATAEYYTRSELDKMIVEKETEIKKLDIQYQLKIVELEQMEYQNNTGEIVAEFDGVVKTALDQDTAIIEGKPMIVISGSSGYTVRASVDEMMLGKINVGDTVFMNCYDNGMGYTGTIKEISDIPVYVDESSNAMSQYMIVIQLDDAEDLKPNMYLEIQIDTQTSPDNICIPVFMVNSEGGRYYVMVENDGSLEKRFVETGSLYWGSYIEVYGGISFDDYIALPYSADAKEGIKTEHGNIMDLYGY